MKARKNISLWDINIFEVVLRDYERLYVNIPNIHSISRWLVLNVPLLIKSRCHLIFSLFFLLLGFCDFVFINIQFNEFLRSTYSKY